MQAKEENTMTPYELSWYNFSLLQSYDNYYGQYTFSVEILMAFAFTEFITV